MSELKLSSLLTQTEMNMLLVIFKCVKKKTLKEAFVTLKEANPATQTLLFFPRIAYRRTANTIDFFDADTPEIILASIKFEQLVHPKSFLLP